MERKVEHKSVSRQVEEIKALSEDILEYRSIDVQKAWLRTVSYTHLTLPTN